MNKNLEQKIYETWVPRLKKNLKNKGITNISEQKLKNIAMMAHTRKVFENSATTANVPGRGAFSFGNNPTNATTFGQKGSGEMFDNLFNLFVDVSAGTAILDLLPVLPMQKSNLLVVIPEPIYAGGKKDSLTDRLPVFQVKVTEDSSPAPLKVGSKYEVKYDSAKAMTLEFVGKHLYNGNYIFRLISVEDTHKDKTVADILDSASHDAHIESSPGKFKFDPNTVDYVNGFTNFINGFTGSGANDDTVAWSVGRNDGKRLFKPMDRQTGETSNVNSYGVKFWSKNFSAETFHADVNYTQEQIQDSKMDYDFDLLSYGDSILQDALAQSMTNHLQSYIFAAGWDHHKILNEVSGVNLNFFVAPNSSTASDHAYVGLDDVVKTIKGTKGIIPASGAISENLSTLQKRIITRMFYSSTIIKNRGRYGKGNTAIVNGAHSTAIRDIRGFQLAPFENDLQIESNMAGIGSFYGIDVFEDGLMNLDDNRIAIYCKGDEKTQGLKLCPYILAEKIDTTAEGTMSQKTRLKSRYTLAQAGSNPQSQYLTFVVDSGDDYSLV